MGYLDAYLHGVASMGTELLTEAQEKVATPDELVRANLRLVPYAIRVASGTWNGRVAYDVLLSIGNEALVLASRNYDGSRGCRFSTYAIKCIVRLWSRFCPVEVERIHTPRYTHECERKARNPKRLAQREKLMEAARKFSRHDVYTAAVGVCTEDAEHGGPEFVAHALSLLGEREALVVRMTVLEGGTLDDAGRILNLSRERVRQLRNEALAQLRGHPSITGAQ